MNLLGEKRGEQRTASAQSGRILAIDYGRKRIGLALSDALGLTAQPLGVILRKNREADLKRLREICARHSVARILVGNPVHITGEESEMSGEATQFAARIAKTLKIDTELVDERLTSWEARQTIAETENRARAKRDAVDDVAAAVLLRDYLEHRREGAAAAVERD
jgi:putative holliday junction resolvase